MKRLASIQERRSRWFGWNLDRGFSGRAGRAWLVMGLLGVALAVVVVATPALASTFSDVNSDTYDNPDYPEAVGALSDLGVIGGFADGTFRPHDAVTRQQFAKMMVKFLGLPVTGNEVCPFTDVPKGTDAKDPLYPDKYIAVCAAHGITTGKTATTFAPYNTITRAQMLSMVVRAARQAGVVLEEPSAAYYAGTIPNSTFRNLKDATHGLNVQTAEMNNLFWGIWPDQGGNWDVYRNASRGEVALVLYRLLQKMGPSGSTTTTVQSTTTTVHSTTTTVPSTTTTVPSTTTTTVHSTTTTTIPSGTLVASDDFSDPTTGWPNMPSWSNGFYYRYESGKYAVEIQPGDEMWLFATYPSLDLTSSRAEADLTVASGDINSGVGLLLRYQDNNDFYLFEIDGAGNFDSFRRVQGTWTDSGWTSSSAFNPMGQSNHVVFAASGNKLSAWINGTLVLSVTDSSLSHGSAGFYAEALGSVPIKATIDNLKVWSL